MSIERAPSTVSLVLAQVQRVEPKPPIFLLSRFTEIFWQVRHCRNRIHRRHAVLGGFHLSVAPPDYVEHTIAELKAMTPDVVIPMHCTGRNFIASMRAEMPEQLVGHANRHPRLCLVLTDQGEH
jgi:hypothetical protein